MGVEAFDAIAEGLEKATGLIARCGIIEALHLWPDGGVSDARKGLEGELVKLYSAMLGYICKAKKHYDSSRASKLIQHSDVSSVICLQ